MLFYILVSICYLAHLCVTFVLHFVLFDKCVSVMSYDVYLYSSK